MFRLPAREALDCPWALLGIHVAAAFARAAWLVTATACIAGVLACIASGGTLNGLETVLLARLPLNRVA